MTWPQEERTIVLDTTTRVHPYPATELVIFIKTILRMPWDIFHRHKDPNHVPVERNVGATVVGATKTTLGIASQALGLLPIPIPQTVCNILLQVITQIEASSVIFSHKAPRLNSRTANHQ